MPLGILAVLAVYFLLGLGRDPYILPSALINTPVAAFDLPAIEGEIKGFSNSDLKAGFRWLMSSAPGALPVKRNMGF